MNMQSSPGQTIMQRVPWKSQKKKVSNVSLCFLGAEFVEIKLQERLKKEIIISSKSKNGWPLSAQLVL